jgi:hypothetical protein
MRRAVWNLVMRGFACAFERLTCDFLSCRRLISVIISVLTSRDIPARRFCRRIVSVIISRVDFSRYSFLKSHRFGSSVEISSGFHLQLQHQQNESLRTTRFQAWSARITFQGNFAHQFQEACIEPFNLSQKL